MKYLIIILLLLPTLLFAQAPIGNKKVPTKILGKTIIDSSLILPRDTVSLSSNERAIAIPDSVVYIFNGEKWVEIQSGNSGIDSIVLNNGGVITSLPEIGFNPNTKDIVKWIDTVFYRSRPPTANLTGGTSLEYRSAQTINQTLNFVAGRQIGTLPIQSININGTDKIFAQPTEGNSYSGIHNVSFPANTDITYQLTVTTTDGRTASSNTSFTFVPKRYYGWINVGDTIGIRNFGYNDAKITSLSNELSTSKSKTWDTGTPSGEKVYVYAYYSSFGDLTKYDMNGFPSLDAMNKVTRQFTNSLGYVGTWTIYWTKNAQTLSSNIVAN